MSSAQQPPERRDPHPRPGREDAGVPGKKPRSRGWALVVGAIALVIAIVATVWLVLFLTADGADDVENSGAPALAAAVASAPAFPAR